MDVFQTQNPGIELISEPSPPRFNVCSSISAYPISHYFLCNVNSLALKFPLLCVSVWEMCLHPVASDWKKSHRALSTKAKV